MMIGQTQARSVTLRLGPEVIARARAHNRGFASYIRDQIQRRLKAEFDKLGEPAPEFFIVIEDTEFGEPHVHGAVTDPGRPGSCDVIRRALTTFPGSGRS